MLLQLVFLAAFLLAPVDCSTLGRLPTDGGINDADCGVKSHGSCIFSYMRNNEPWMPIRNTYIPREWYKCNDTEDCRTGQVSVLIPQNVNTDKCGTWERCKQHQGLQSPVNLNLEDAQYEDFNPRYIDADDVPGNFTNNGHSPTFTVEGKGVHPSNAVIFRGVPDREESDYIFYELHFHIGNKTNKEIGSEHSINNEFHDGEIHLVHWKHDDETPTPKIAEEAEGGLMGIAVFFNVESEPHVDSYVDDLINNYVAHIKDVPSCVKADVNPEKILPEKRCVYSYAGSKTTPPCMETVQFLVYTEPIKISEQSYDILATLDTTDGPTGKALLADYGNRRPIQGRPVDDLVTNCEEGSE